MMFDSLKNKTAVITGAAQGIGFETAKQFLTFGSRVALIDVQSDRLLESTKALQQAFPSGHVKPFTVDITHSDAANAAVGEILGTFGSIDILVNNAGILRDSTLLKMDEKQFDQVIDVHLKGSFLLGQACAKGMVEKKYGKIVNLSSIASRGNFGQTNYSAAKAGLIGMTKTWSLELSKHGINVNAIAPGLIETDMTRSIPENIRNAMVSKIPLQRMGSTLEVAYLICFLCSDAASYIQGEVIHINGGMLM